MDTQPGQTQIPHDNDSNQGLPQQPPVGSEPEVSLPPVQMTPTAMLPQAPETSEVPAPVLSPSAPQSPVPAVDAPQTEDPNQIAGLQYGQAVDISGVEPLPEDVSWTAAEFVEHPKSASWYALLTLAAVVLSVVDYYVTKDWFSAIIIIIAAVMFGVYAGHKPRTQNYHLGPKGLQIGNKTYAFQTFKEFSVTEEGATSSIMFTPLARFAAPITIYVASDIEDKVLDYLSLFLPFEQRHADAVDGLLRRIRF